MLAPKASAGGCGCGSTTAPAIGPDAERKSSSRLVFPALDWSAVPGGRRKDEGGSCGCGGAEVVHGVRPNDADGESPESGRGKRPPAPPVAREPVPRITPTEKLLDLARRAVPNPAQSLLMQGWALDGLLAGAGRQGSLPKGDRQPVSKAGSSTSSASACGIEVTRTDTCSSVFTFPEPDYSFDVDRDFRDEVLSFVWDPAFGMDRGLSNDDIDGMFVDWEVPSGEGAFLDGPRRVFVRWAIRLIELYRDEIPENGEFCPNARTEVSDRLDKRGYRFHVNDDGPVLALCGDKRCSPGTLELQLCGDTSIPSRAEWVTDDFTPAAQFPCFTDRRHIQICADYVCIGAAEMDLFLLEAGRRMAYVRDGRAGSCVASLYYLTQALGLGRLALSVVLEFAYIILHEMLHVEFPGGHCANNCCMQRLSSKFRCRLRARLGLFSAKVGAISDLSLEDPDWCDASTCRENANPPEAGKISTGCTFTKHGQQAGSDDWEPGNCLGSSRWTSPEGCPS